MWRFRWWRGDRPDTRRTRRERETVKQLWNTIVIKITIIHVQCVKNNFKQPFTFCGPSLLIRKPVVSIQTPVRSFQWNCTTLTDFSHFKCIWVLAWTRRTFRVCSLFFKPSIWNLLYLDWNNLYRSRNDFVSKRPLTNPMAIQAFRRSLIGATESSAPSETHYVRFIALSRRIGGWSFVSNDNHNERT